MSALDPSIGITLVVGTLTILLFLGLVVLLLVVSHNRRNRDRAQLAEERVRHAEEVRKVEREVLAQTLTEVGRDLHDNIGQLLTVTRMGLNKLLTLEKPTADQAGEVKTNLDTTIAEVRRLSRTLNSERLNELSLAQVITYECDRIRRTGAIEVVVREMGHEPLLSADEKIVLFRIFQELMNNALKHAQASRIEVLIANGERTRIQVKDDGIGFLPQQRASDKGQGLENIRRRASLIGYHCELTSTPGAGTTVTISAK